MGGLGWVKENGPTSISAIDSVMSLYPVYRQTSYCRFAAVGSVAGDIDRLLQQRRATGECGQRHFVSVRR